MQRLVLVEWWDSRQPVPRWLCLDEVDGVESCACVSVGFLIRETENEIVLAPNLADLDDDELVQGSGIITIPRCSVKNVVDLERPTTVGEK